MKIWMRLICGVTVVTMLAFCMWGVWEMVRDHDEYRRLEDTAVQVTARIVRVKEHEVDDDTDYKLYITYTYQNRNYSNIYYKTVNKARTVGEHVTIHVDPADPTCLRPDDPGLFVLLPGFFAGVAAFGLVCYLGGELAKDAAQANWPMHYGTGLLSSELVQQDIQQELARAWILRLVVTGVLLAAAVIGAALYRSAYGTATGFWAFLFPAVLALVAVLLWTRPGEPQVQLETVTFEKFQTDRDSDGDPVRMICFTELGALKVSACELISLTGQDWKAATQETTTFYAALVNGKYTYFFSSREFRTERI